MKTLEEVLEILDEQIDRPTLEEYIARQWIRPHRKKTDWHFEEIDIARLQLVCHLTQDIEVNDEGMDVVLSLLDQLYGMRVHMQKMNRAIAQQPAEVQTSIKMVIKQWVDPEEKS